MNEPTLFDALERQRLTGAMLRVRGLMRDGKWRTLHEISEACSPMSEAAASAWLRKLRAAGDVVDKKLAGPGLWLYKVIVRA